MTKQTFVTEENGQMDIIVDEPCQRICLEPKSRGLALTITETLELMCVLNNRVRDLIKYKQRREQN